MTSVAHISLITLFQVPFGGVTTGVVHMSLTYNFFQVPFGAVTPVVVHITLIYNFVKVQFWDVTNQQT